MEMKKLYERPSVNVIAMEMEQVMASYSSVNPGKGFDDRGYPIIESGMPEDDGTDLTKATNENHAKPYNVWE